MEQINTELAKQGLKLPDGMTTSDFKEMIEAKQIRVQGLRWEEYYKNPPTNLFPLKNPLFRNAVKMAFSLAKVVSPTGDIKEGLLIMIKELEELT